MFSVFVTIGIGSIQLRTYIESDVYRGPMKSDVL